MFEVESKHQRLMGYKAGDTMSDTNSGREHVGRIHHTLFIYQNRENQLKARDEFSSVLKIDDWQEVGEVPEGLSVLISWSSGIELVFPVIDNPAYQKHLDKFGEGFYGMVFGVEDLASSVEHIEKVTGKAPFILKETPKPVYEVFDVAKEAVVGSLGGVKVLLGEFLRKDASN